MIEPSDYLCVGYCIIWGERKVKFIIFFRIIRNNIKWILQCGFSNFEVEQTLDGI